MKYIYLLFSGGKDSTACLCQLEHAGLLSKVKLLFVKSDATLPEQIDYVHGVADRCAGIVEVSGKPLEWSNENGYPSDVVPVENTSAGIFCNSGEKLKVIDRYACCSANLWKPMNEAISRLDDCEMLVVGDKYCDKNKVVFPEVLTAAGRVPVVRPVFFWTDEQVRDFLAENGLWIKRFEMSHSSLDCWHCTAYWSAYKERQDFLDRCHPDKGRVLKARMDAVRGAVKKQIQIVEE